MEVSDIGAKNTNCRVRYKNQSVLIPISEMGIELSNRYKKAPEPNGSSA